MKIQIDCKYAKVWDSKCIKCKRDGSLRNVIKKPCHYDCPHYKKRRFFFKMTPQCGQLNL